MCSSNGGGGGSYTCTNQIQKKVKKKKKIDEPSASNILARLYPIVITPHPSHLTLLLYRAAVSLS
jgi:hypothetical protein